MWDNGGGFEEFSTRCQILESHDIATCEMWGRRHWNYFDQCNRKGCDHIVGLLNACSSVLPLEMGSCAHEHIIHSGWDSATFVGSSSLFEIVPNCGSFRGGYLECSTKWILKI
jgi:hypothetical protein